MSSSRRRPPLRAPASRIASGEEFRRMILLLETAAVLESRAERAADPTQAATLRRRAEQRICEAEAIRDVLALDGGGPAPGSADAPTSGRRASFIPTSSSGRRSRT